MSRLALYLLGPPRIELDGEPVHISRRKVVALLAYLAVTETPHSRDALATLLWPERSQSRARAYLRRALSELNRTLGEGFLTIDRETAGLDPNAGPSSTPLTLRDASQAGFAQHPRRPERSVGDLVADRRERQRSERTGQALSLDVNRFRQYLAAAETHNHPATEVCSDCVTPLEEAVELYSDDFTAGFTLRDSPDFDEWQFFEREALRGEFASALERLVRWHSSQREYDRAIAYARRWLALDPLAEAAHRRLMALYGESGQRNAALRQYAECERLLQEELGLPPEEETRALAQTLSLYFAP
jgi:DNA-binding SARP family transcriptional activator